MFTRKFKITFITGLLSLTTVSFLQTHEANAAISNKPGDIITTKSTSAPIQGYGLTGHNGIYITATKILHTPGKMKAGSSSDVPVVIDEKDWHKAYPSSKVIRPNSEALGKKAASMAVKYFKGKNIKYKITPIPTNINYTYCSELVWFSYYKAGKTYNNGDGSAIIHPYIFVTNSLVKYNGFKFIDNNW